MSQVLYPSRAFKSFIWFSGIILPVYCVLLEALVGLCRNAVFDPLPTPFHALLILSGALAAYLGLRSLKKGRLEYPRLTALLLGAGLVSSSIYLLAFLPLLPAGVILSAYSIVGLFMPLLLVFPIFGPLLSFVAQCWLLKRVFSHFSASATKLWCHQALGVLLSVLLLSGLEARILYTTVAVERLEERRPDPKTLRNLRVYGDRNVLLELAYYGQSKTSGIFAHIYKYFADLPSHGIAGAAMRGPDSLSLDRDTARQFYYQITGTPFNENKAPRRSSWAWDNWFWDSELGTQAVGGKIPGLSLIQSQIHGSIDADAGLGYFEWTLEFENRGQSQQEARAEIQLPPESLVSRATLWVNGEEQEAAFAPRAQAIRAYTSVVRRQRDPLLVTFAGKDRALVQCFPVPPQGGRMKVRIGVTSPLNISDLQRAELYLPQFSQRNFNLERDLKSEVWFESKQNLKSSLGSLKSEEFRDTYALRGSVQEGQNLVISAARRPEVAKSYANDLLEKNWVVQELLSQERGTPANYVIVVDGSGSMRTERDRVATLLENLFSDELSEAQFTALIASDTISTITDQFVPARPENIAKLVGALRRYPFEGGTDNGEALLAAWDLGIRNPNTRILWLHGPQPVAFTSMEILKSRYERRSEGPTLFSLPVLNGVNSVTRIMGSQPQFQPLHPGQLQNREELAQTLSLGKRLRRAFLHSNQPPVDAKRTSDHLARLWAGAEVQRLLETRRTEARDAAAELASRYSILTEVSGAVALENDEQYQQNGLQKSGHGLVPSVPEPGAYALMLLVLLALISRTRWQRRCVGVDRSI